jgi:tetratricopeptide (TPR) repeat protein
MRVKFTTPLVLVTLATLPACVTSRPHGGSAQTSTAKAIAANKAKPLAKEGQKTQDGADAAAPAATATPDAAPVATDLTRTYNRLSDPTMQLMEEDIRAATALHPAPKGSMEEAVLILAQLRLLKIQTEQSTKFQSRDLYEQGDASQQAAAPNPNLPSMEKQFRDLDIDLVTSFNQNTHLKTLPTLALVKTLLEQTSNSPTFQSGMQTIIDQEAQKWAALQKTAKPEEPPTPSPETAAPAPVDATASVPAAPEPSLSTAPGDGHTGPADLKRSDAILMQSQKLADKGEFKQAIDFAARIDTRDPFFDQAKEKIKIYSNRAVQDLRQKAAQAFQNAMPVADNRAKAAYLKQAKELLEQALKDYPVADQLDTVRDNLSVITRDLSGIDQETAGANTPKTQ